MSMDDLDLNARIERYMNRELHPAAARAMAHEALDDSDLFEELTAVALVQAALESPATTDRALAKSALDDQDLFDTLVARGAVEAAVRVPNRRGHRTIVIAALAAVAAVLLTFLVLRPSVRPSVHSAAQQARASVTKPAVSPTILLSGVLEPARSPGAPIFRGSGAASRPPKSGGMVVS